MSVAQHSRKKVYRHETKLYMFVIADEFSTVRNTLNQKCIAPFHFDIKINKFIV